MGISKKETTSPKKGGGDCAGKMLAGLVLLFSLEQIGKLLVKTLNSLQLQESSERKWNLFGNSLETFTITSHMDVLDFYSTMYSAINLLVCITAFLTIYKLTRYILTNYFGFTLVLVIAGICIQSRSQQLPCQEVFCENGGGCDAQTGSCICPSGFSGSRCDEYLAIHFHDAWHPKYADPTSQEFVNLDKMLSERMSTYMADIPNFKSIKAYKFVQSSLIAYFHVTMTGNGRDWDNFNNKLQSGFNARSIGGVGVDNLLFHLNRI